MTHKLAPFAVGSIALLLLSGCTPLSTGTHGHNYVKIYNAQNQQIYAATGKQGQTIVDRIPQDYHNLSQQKLPTNAQPSYRYVMHHAKHDIKITLQLYTHTRYVKLSGIPVIGGGMVKLTKKNYHKLTHPRQFIAE